MNRFDPSVLLMLALAGSASAFLPIRRHVRLQTTQYYHPAVEGWEQKYIDEGGSCNLSDAASGCRGPKIISSEFDVHRATEEELNDLDVKNWPEWTTKGNEKWSVGNRVVDKEMPYGELSYVTAGKLEIIPQSSGDRQIVAVGDLVTFPRGFVASWTVLEELTWNYYLY